MSVNICHHLKLKIADAISSFKWWQIFTLWKITISNILLFDQYTFCNNNAPHGEQRWTVLIRQLLHTFQWQHTTQWATRNCFNQTIVHCANSCKQSIVALTKDIMNLVSLFRFTARQGLEALSTPIPLRAYPALWPRARRRRGRGYIYVDLSRTPVTLSVILMMDGRR